MLKLRLSRSKPVTADELNEADVERAREQLADVDARLTTLRAARDDLSTKLGQAFGDLKLGDKTMSTKAGELSLKRAGIEREIAELELTRDALKEPVETWDAAEKQRKSDAAFMELLELSDVALLLQDAYATQLVALAETGQALQAARICYFGLRQIAGYVPPDSETASAPPLPVGLDAAHLRAPRTRMNSWLGAPVFVVDGNDHDEQEDPYAHLTPKAREVVAWANIVRAHQRGELNPHTAY